MSRIDDLIRDLCPGGVEHKLLKDLVRIKNGRDFKHLKQGDIPVYGSGGVISYVNESASEGPSVLIPRKGSLNKLYFVEGPFWTVDTIFYTEISSQLEPKYFYYYLQTLHLEKMNQAGGVPSLTQRTLNELHIPTPPILIQREIARVLDQFSQLKAELETELEAELEARRQQYFHYCASAFDSATDAEWTTLERVSFKISSGGTPSSSNSAYYGGDIPWVRSQDVNFNMISSTSATISDIGLKNSAAKWIPSNTLIIAMYGASAARAAINTIPVTTNQACCNLQLDTTKVTPEYAYHWIYSQYDKLRSLGEGSQSNLNARKIKNYPIPVPSLNEQRRITDALDQFHSLVNDLTSGLPAEIEARRKQYEYYRDRLLTFPEKK